MHSPGLVELVRVRRSGERCGSGARVCWTRPVNKPVPLNREFDFAGKLRYPPEL